VRAAPVGDQDGEALLGEPLRDQGPPVQLRGDPLPVRSAVGVEHGQAPAWTVPGGEVERGAQLARPEGEAGGVDVEHRPFHP
jgi:hypothetical protein